MVQYIWGCCGVVFFGVPCGGGGGGGQLIDNTLRVLNLERGLNCV